MRRMPSALFAMLVVIILVTPFLLFIPVSYSFDCARRGDTMSMVVSNCGEPTWVESRGEQRRLIAPPGTILDGWYIARAARPILVNVQIEK